MSSGNLETTWTKNYLTLCLCVTYYDIVLCNILSEHNSKYQKMLKLCSSFAADNTTIYITTNGTLRGINDDVRLSLLILAYHRQS